MKKQTPGRPWPALEKGKAPVLKDAPAAYPTSNKRKKNWSEIGGEDEGKPEGDEALNKLFKDIYGNATEETRRAMVRFSEFIMGIDVSSSHSFIFQLLAGSAYY